ncbi:hypothetical protein AGENTSMITH_193 [Bacillus phage vB_BspM_AgentSmith]|nr:hypothetical protein AGENTSMITH_193 [Bacillus phage vB_BspM_AgentSmith]
MLSHIVTVSLKDKTGNVLFSSRLATEKYDPSSRDVVRYGVHHTFNLILKSYEQWFEREFQSISIEEYVKDFRTLLEEHDLNPNGSDELNVSIDGDKFLHLSVISLTHQ